MYRAGIARFAQRLQPSFRRSQLHGAQRRRPFPPPLLTRRTHAIIGAALALSIVMTTLPRAQAEDLYAEIRAMTQQEERKDTIESEVANFVAAVIRKNHTQWSDVAAEDVTLAIQGKLGTLCAKGKPTSAAAAVGGTGVSVLTCLDIANEIVAMAHREQDLRTFGRKLQALATRDELPVEGLRGNATDLVSHEQALLNIWKTGAGQDGDLPGSREIPVTEDDIADSLAAIGGNLAALSREEQIAAVWRYRRGVRTSGMPSDTKDPKGTERQWLLGSWESIETPLKNIWDVLLQKAATMNLRDGEYAVLLSMPVAKGAGGIPGKVYVWGTVDRDLTGVHPLGDVGLRWDIATEPVQPSLSSSEPILGGAFPPTATDGQGLCGHPVAALGYLCRSVVADDEENPCAESPLENDTAISLTSCTDKEGNDRTLAGPDICAGIDWHTLSADDQKYTCTLKDANGRSKVGCASVCVDAQTGLSDEWHTYAKNADGSLSICLDSDDTSLPYQYNLMRGLSLAEDVCTLPYDAPLPADCCRLAGEANNAMCRMMEDDGVFTGTDGKPAVSTANIPFTTQTCTEALTQEFCAAQGVNCAVTREYEGGGIERFTTEIEIRANERSPYAKQTCASAITTPDPRNQALMDAIEARDDISRPGREITYLNTIGNQLCAAGSYLEEMLTYHTVVGGRVPYTIMDDVAPWTVGGLADEDDDGAKALLKTLEGSADVSGPLPLYRPALLAKTYDISRCGVTGLPPLTPPELCILDAQQRFTLPLGTFFDTVESATTESDAVRTATETTGRGAAAVGTRMVNDYYGNYLHAALQSLSGVLSTTDDLLERLRLQSSPSVMCPSEATPDLQGGSALSVASSPTGSSASSASR